MSAITAVITNDKHGPRIKFGAGTQAGVFRPQASVLAPGPCNAFNKTRSPVGTTEFATDDIYSVSPCFDLEKRRYLVVYTKEHPGTKGGRRELWSFHGDWVAGFDFQLFTPAGERKPVTQRVSSSKLWSRTDRLIKCLDAAKR